MYLPADLPLGRLLSRSRWLTIAIVVLLALALGGGILYAATGEFLDMRHPDLALPTRIILIASGAVVLLMPVVAGVFATIHTAVYARSETYQLLRLTSLPHLTLIRLHITLVLHRLRWLMLLSLVLTPAFFMRLMHRTLLNTFRLYPAYPVNRHWMELPAPPTNLPAWRAAMLGWTPEVAGWVIGLWGVMLLAVVVGVGLTLRWRLPVLTGPLAALSALLLPALLLLPIVLLPVERWEEWPRSLLVVALAAGPYLLALGLMRVVKRWA